MAQLSEWSTLVRAWAEEVIRRVEEFYAARDEHWHLLEIEAHDEDWTPDDEEISGAFRRHWVASHQVIWSSYQLNRWIERYYQSRDEEAPTSHNHLKDLRDALEHLDEAVWLNGYTLGPPPESRRAGRGLRSLPGKSLIFGLGFDGQLFGLIDADSLHRRAMEIINEVDQMKFESWQEEAEYLAERDSKEWTNTPACDSEHTNQSSTLDSPPTGSTQ